MNAAENRRGPDAVELKRVQYIEAGSGEPACQVLLVEGTGVSVGPGVNSVGHTILRVQLERLTEIVAQCGEQCVEMRRAVVCVKRDAMDHGIECQSRNSADVVQIVMLGKMAR